MDKMTVIYYYDLGTIIRYLQDADTSCLIKGGANVIVNIDALLSKLERFGLSVTARTNAIMRLKDFRKGLIKASEEEDKDQKNMLSESQADALEEIISEVRPTLEAEMKGFSVFLITPKRIDVNKLLDDIPSLFPPTIYSAMPKIAQYDFSEAGRCIAFERPTAAAFHILRGTEAVLRNFYCTLIKQRRVNPLLWGPVVSDLRKRNKTKGYVTLYNNLDNIRVSFRNPTQHPEALYDIHEAQDLWSLCMDVVNRMIKIQETA